MELKHVVILGSTGSIGINTLDVISRHPKKFKLLALTAFNNLELLLEQIRIYSPKYVAVSPDKIGALKRNINTKRIKVLNVDEDITTLVAEDIVDIVVIGMSGSAALEPFLAAVKHGKTVAPANKEALVIAGDLIIKNARKFDAKIIPIDSEQSAIFQCLEGHNRNELKRVYLTASGGPLHNIPQSKFDQLKVEDILKHPRWKMGKKITVDSATLMNKGFEVIEAIRLFDLEINEIEIIIHPEAIIHSMVCFKDGSILAQLGITDMRLPIQYALSYPQRWDSGLSDMDFFTLEKLTFCRPDLQKFPALALAIEVAKKGGTFPSVLNAADEVAVNAFLDHKILFTQIYGIIEKVIQKHKNTTRPQLKDILAADRWAREETQNILAR